MSRRTHHSGPGSPRRRRAAVARVGLVGLALAALFPVVYLAAARRLLGTNLLRSLVNTHPDSTRIEYDEAVSGWPGRLRVKNLRIRGRDQNVEWLVRVDELRAVYSVGSLLRRTFHVRSARGSGLSFRLRTLRRPGDLSPPPVEMIPSIPGFPDPPRVSSAPAKRKASNGRPWAVHVEDLRIESFDEIWVEVYRSRGPARLEGSFFLRPGRKATIGPAEIELLAGDLRVGKEPVLSSRTGRLKCRIDTYDPRRVRGEAVWGKTSGEVLLEGRLEGMSFLNHFLRRSSEPRLSGGDGTASLEGRIERGAARGTVRVRSNGVEARTAGAVLQGDSVIALRIPSWNLKRGPLDLSGSRVELSDATARESGSRNWWGRFDFPSARLDRTLQAKVEVQCRDARPLLALLNTGLPQWAAGLLELEGLTASAELAAGPSLLRVRRLDAKGGSFHIEGEYRRKGRDKDGLFLIDAGKVNVGIAVDDGKAGLRLFGARDWFEKARAAGLPEEAASAQRARSTTAAVP
jgi:hypothetical protein